VTGRTVSLDLDEVMQYLDLSAAEQMIIRSHGTLSPSPMSW
jgi:hypothetical protein